MGAELITAYGIPLRLRPIDADDRHRLAVAFARMSVRARYDRFGHAGLDGAQLHTEQFMDLGNLGDIFGALFGRDVFGGRGPRPGGDLEAEAEITLEQAALGHKLELDVEVVVDHAWPGRTDLGAHASSLPGASRAVLTRPDQPQAPERSRSSGRPEA